MATNGTITARERINDGNGRNVDINHNFRNVEAPEVGAVTAGIHGNAPTQPQPPAPPTKKRTRGLFG